MEDTSSKTKNALLTELKHFEEADDFFIISNFDQKTFTNDFSVGHISPVGAFDSEKNQVLILDTDRKYFSPYWVSLDHFLEGMHTLDSSHQKYRGYLVIHLKN